MSDKRRILKGILNWTLVIVGSFLLVLLVNSRVFAKVQVKQSSMEKTLYPKQQLIVDKFRYNFGKPERGDIIIFLEGEERGTVVEDSIEIIENLISLIDKNRVMEDNRLVKRVIGISGDVVDIKDGYVYINGEALEEPYALGETSPREVKLPITVGENQLFVLGDNRRVSNDSRAFGLINCNQVEGKVVFRIFPLNKSGVVK